MQRRQRRGAACNRLRKGGRPASGLRRLVAAWLAATVAAAGAAWADGAAAASGASSMVVVGYREIATPGLDEALGGRRFGELPDAVGFAGVRREAALGSGGWRAGSGAWVGFAQSSGPSGRARLIELFVEPRIAYQVAPARWLSFEAGLGVALGISALTVIHSDPATFDDALGAAHESTLWRPAVLLVPEAGVTIAPVPALGVQLSAAYAYDPGWLGGWRNAAAELVAGAPDDALGGVRYRVALVWRPGLTVPAPPRAEQRPPRRAFLGVRAVSLDVATASRLKLSDTRGAYVVEVLPGSPADRAGLQAGDVVRRLGSTEILSAQHLEQELERYRPGDWVVVRVWRVETRFLFFTRGRVIDAVVELGEQPSDAVR